MNGLGSSLIRTYRLKHSESPNGHIPLAGVFNVFVYIYSAGKHGVLQVSRNFIKDFVKEVISPLFHIKDAFLAAKTCFIAKNLLSLQA